MPSNPLVPPGNKEAARAIPTPTQPSPHLVAGSYKTEIYTYFTKVEETLLYTGDQPWAVVTLKLETAGPVAVSTKQGIEPVLSGKGQLLTTGVEISFTVAKGNRIFIAAASPNRVAVKVEQIAWAEQIVGSLQAR
jgi:hypothetical protein